MSREWSRRRVVSRAVLAGVVVLASLVPSGAAQAQDPDVDAARAARDAAIARVREVEAALDAAAGLYERASAHAERMDAESADDAQVVDAARAGAAAADAAFREQIAQTYKHPDAATAVAQVVLGAPDAATALHRAELWERAAAGVARSADSVIAAAERSADVVRQEQVVRAGAAAAAAARYAHAEAVTDVLGQAERAAAAAGDALADAEAAARRRAAERAAAEAAALAAAEAAAAAARAGAGGPLPVIDGKTCPIGAPNGFIDSWGFPRSGGRRHQGVDMFAAYGTPLYAVADATVVAVGSNRLGGLTVSLVDGAGDRYYYAHLASTAVERGQRVAVGTVIGSTGDSGNARGTPPHLHWQVHPGGGVPVNPYPLARALCR
jgi:murein DD-endopeptidase MepM/ murein hydrolase activator NlpD